MAFEGGVFIDVLGRLNIPSFDKVLKDVQTMMKEAGKTSGAAFDKTFGDAIASGGKRAFDPLVEESNTAFKQMQLGMAELQRAEAQINNLRAQNFKRSTDAMIAAQRELDAAIANTDKLIAASNSALLDRRAAVGALAPGGRHSAEERTPSTGNGRAVAGRGEQLAEEGAVVAGAGYVSERGAEAGSKASELSQSFSEHVLAHRTAAYLEKGGRAILKGGGIGSLLGLAGAAGYGTRSTIRVQENLAPLRSLQNESPANIAAITQAAWDQATQTGYNPDVISKLYPKIESANNPITGGRYRGQDAITIGRTALQLARVAQIEPEVALQGLTTSLFNYHTGPQGAVGMANLISRGLAGFKGSATDYFEAQHTIEPVAEMAGIRAPEVFGLLDVASQTGQSAQQTGQAGRNLIKALSRPNSIQSGAMQQLGLNPETISTMLSQNGIGNTLAQVNQALAAHAGPNGTIVLGAMANKPLMQQQQQLIAEQMSPQAQQYIQSDAFQKSLVSGFKARNLILKAGGQGISQSDMPLIETWLQDQKKIMGASDVLKRNQPMVQNLYGAFSSVYGTQEAAQMAMMAAGSPEALAAYQKQTGALGNAQKNPGEFTKAFQDAMAPQSMQWKKLQQDLGKLSAHIGQNLLPTIEAFTHKLEGILTFFDQHKAAEKALIDAMLGLAGLYVAQKLKLGKALNFLLPGFKDNMKGMFGGNKGGGGSETLNGGAAAKEIQTAMAEGGVKASGTIGTGMTEGGVKAGASISDALLASSAKAATTIADGLTGGAAKMGDAITVAGGKAGAEMGDAIMGAGSKVAAEIGGAEAGAMPGGIPPGGAPPGEGSEPGKGPGKWIKGIGGALKWLPYVGQAYAIGQEQDQANQSQAMKDYLAGKIPPGDRIDQVGGQQGLGLLPKQLPPNPYKGNKPYLNLPGFAGGGITSAFSQPLFGVPDTGGDSVLGMLPNGTPVGLRGGEGILTPEAVSALGGPEGIDQINKNPWSNPAKVATTFYSSFAKGMAQYSPWGKYLVANSQSLSDLEKEHEQADKDQRRAAGGYFAGIRDYMRMAYGSNAKYMPGYYNDMFGGQMGNVYHGGGGGSVGGNPATMHAIGMAAAEMGLSQSEYNDVKWIFQRESGFDPTVSNGGGHGPPSNNKAFGLGQFLGHMGDKYGQMGAYSGDPGLEAKAAIQYMKDRYGGPAGAKAYWETHGNYAGGGIVGQPGGMGSNAIPHDEAREAWWLSRPGWNAHKMWQYTGPRANNDPGMRIHGSNRDPGMGAVQWPWSGGGPIESGVTGHRGKSYNGMTGFWTGGIIPLAPPPPPNPSLPAPPGLDRNGVLSPGQRGPQVIQSHPNTQQSPYHFAAPGKDGQTPPGAPYDPLHAYGGGEHHKPGPKPGSHHHRSSVHGNVPDRYLIPGGTAPKGDRNIQGNPSQQLTSQGKGFGIGGGLIGAAESAAAGMGGPFGAAAQPAFQLINRAIGYGGQLVGIGIKGLMETFLPNDSPAADPSKNIFGKIALGIAGAHPSGKNAAGAHAMQLHPKEDLDKGAMQSKQMPGIHVENIHNHSGSHKETFNAINKAVSFGPASGASIGVRN